MFGQAESGRRTKRRAMTQSIAGLDGTAKVEASTDEVLGDAAEAAAAARPEGGKGGPRQGAWPGKAGPGQGKQWKGKGRG